MAAWSQFCVFNLAIGWDLIWVLFSILIFFCHIFWACYISFFLDVLICVTKVFGSFACFLFLFFLFTLIFICTADKFLFQWFSTF